MESPAAASVDPKLTLAMADLEEPPSERASILSGPNANGSVVGFSLRGGSTIGGGSILGRNGSVLGRYSNGSINNGYASRRSRRGAVSLKPPILLETRKLLPAYVSQLSADLNTASKAHAWTKKKS